MYDVLSHSGRSGPRGSVHYCQRVGSPGSLNRESSFDPERKVGTGLLPLWSTDVSYQGIFGRPHILKKIGFTHLKLRLQNLFPFGPRPLYLFEFLLLGNFGSFDEQPMKCIYANVCKSELPDFELGN